MQGSGCGSVASNTSCPRVKSSLSNNFTMNTFTEKTKIKNNEMKLTMEKIKEVFICGSYQCKVRGDVKPDVLEDATN